MLALKRIFFLFAIVSIIAGCQSAYYSAMESVGQHKRDILVDRVEKANESQEDAQQEFTDALEALSTLINFDGGELQEQYEVTKDHYEASEKAATEVSNRIEAIEDVADALFDEWSDEIDEYTSASLKRSSESKLKETQRRYKKVMKSMYRAENSMQPALSALKDNMLYLKHNLNAKAIGALEGEYKNLKGDIEQLIKEMDIAINNSKQFISKLQSE